MIMADSAMIEGADPSVLAAKVRADCGVIFSGGWKNATTSFADVFCGPFNLLPIIGQGEFDPSFIVTNLGKRLRMPLQA